MTTSDRLSKSLRKIEYIRQILQHPQKSEQWLTQRKGKLTSSDAATALGINPYESPEKLLFKKCGISDGFTSNQATKHGEKYETEAINIYCSLMNKKNYEFGLIEYNSINAIRKNSDNDLLLDVGFLAGSPDGVAVDNDNLEDEILIEVKCPLRRKIKLGQIPEYYLPQVQLNMAILDIEKADFIEYVPKGVEPLYLSEPILNIVRVHRDRKWFNKNVPILYDFWASVLHYRSIGIANHEKYHLYAGAGASASASIITCTDTDSDNEKDIQVDFRDDDEIDKIDKIDKIENIQLEFRDDD